MPFSRWEAELSIKHALLGLLAQGEYHGYELKAAVESELAPLSSLNFGQVYTALDRLEQEGFVSHRTVEQTERPAKKVFSLTEGGRRELTTWMQSPSTPDLDLRNATFFKLILARMLDPEFGGPDALDVIRVERRAGFERLHEVAAARARAGDEGHPREVALLLELASLRLEAFLKWLDTCEAVYRPTGKRTITGRPGVEG
jgi:DNA-binding PadR family transcriptional regulator